MISMLRNFEEWSSFQEFNSRGKGSQLRFLTLDFLVNIQYFLHIIWLSFHIFKSSEAGIFGEGALKNVLALASFSVMIDLITKVVECFGLLNFRRRNQLIFIMKIINLQIVQILFLTVSDATLRNGVFGIEEKMEQILTLFINYFISYIYLSMGFIRWDLLFVQHLINFLIFKIITLARWESSELGKETEAIFKYMPRYLNALIAPLVIMIIVSIRKKLRIGKILTTFLNGSPVGKILIKEKHVVFANDAVNSKFFGNFGVDYEELSKLIFNRYSSVNNSKIKPVCKITKSSRRQSTQFVRKFLYLSDIVEILKRDPCQSLSLYTKIRKTTKPSFTPISRSNLTNTNSPKTKDFQNLLTEGHISTEGDFSDVFQQQIQVRVSYLDWQHLGSEYIYMEFTDISEAQSIMEAEQMIEYKTNILNSFSHELKTPLNISKNIIQTLASNDHLPIELKDKYLDPVQASLNMLDYLIHDIVDFLKIETNQLDLVINKFDFKTVVKQALHLFEYQRREKQIEIVQLIEESKSFPVLTDERRLLRVLINIISLIVKTNEKITLEVAITLTKENYYSLSLHKKGLNGHYADYKSDSSILKKANKKSPISKDLDCVPENDFGLIISKLILENLIDHGVEDFSLASIDDNEVLFKLFMSPLPEVDHEEKLKASCNIKSLEMLEGTTNVAAAISPHLLDGVSEYPHPKNCICYENENCPQVLLVDDDPFNILSLSLTLEKMKIKTLKAINGLEAIEVYKTYQQTHKCISCSGIRVILMDLMMPVMNGMESCKILLDMMSNREVPQSPIYACSANDSKDIISECKEIGFAGFLPKPVNQENLKKALACLFKLDSGTFDRN